MALSIKLKSVDRVHQPGSKVEGVVVVDTNGSLSHAGVTLVAQGTVKPQLSARSVGIFEAFYSSIKPVTLLHEEVEMVSGGKFPPGVTELPFSFDVDAVDGQDLVETYHGVYVSITYTITCTMARGAFSKSITAETEFIVEVPDPAALPDAPQEFTVSPDSLENVKTDSISSIPDFKITGKLHKTNCAIDKPFTGELVVEKSEEAIKSIELQLVRVETVCYAEGKAREATEILNLQLADGDVCRNLVIPMYIIFPRLFTCPTTSSDTFSVEFEMNLVILFEGAYMVTENFPVTLFR